MRIGAVSQIGPPPQSIPDESSMRAMMRRGLCKPQGKSCAWDRGMPAVDSTLRSQRMVTAASQIEGNHHCLKSEEVRQRRKWEGGPGSNVLEADYYHGHLYTGTLAIHGP